MEMSPGCVLPLVVGPVMSVAVPIAYPVRCRRPLIYEVIFIRIWSVWVKFVGDNITLGVNDYMNNSK